jgi:hypothetical protein
VRELLQPDIPLFLVVSDDLPVEGRSRPWGVRAAQVLATPLRDEAQLQILRAVDERRG